jgi:hypothetical protein
MLKVYCLIAAISLSASANMACAQSQRKPPGTGSQPQSQTQSSQQGAPRQERGTEQTPFVVKVQPSPISPEKAANEAADHDEDAKAKRDTVEAGREAAYWTKIIGIIAAFQFIALGGQLFVFGIQAKRLREATEATARAATAAERQTNAWIAAEAPRLHFLDFKLVRYNPDGTDEAERITDAPHRVIRPLVLIRNGGRKDMGLIGYSIDWTVTKELSSPPIYQNTLGGTIFIPREDQIWLMDLLRYMNLADDDLVNIERGEAYLWFYGFITYLNDITDEIVQRGYVAQWNASSSAFHAQGPKDYAYEKRSTADLAQP